MNNDSKIVGRSSFPSHIVSPPSLRPEELLFLCYYDPDGISTVPETCAYIQEYSRFSVTVLNMFEHGRNGVSLSLSPHIDLQKFDGIVIHNSIAYDVVNLRSIDKLLACKIRDFEGVKVLMKQDENHKYRELADYIGETKFDLIFTCLPPESISTVYPKSVVGSPLFSRMLTGYVTPTLRSFSRASECRSIDIGYRGSIQPLHFGRLAYEKRKIGDEVAKLAKLSGLSIDISSRWEDRFGNTGWLEFLSNCKATLGVESGASIFDLNGDLATRCAEAIEQYGPISEDAGYAEMFLKKLSDMEGLVNYNQISPRHFEAAATRTLQIMYPGEYSGIFKKGRHYVELARDHSNIEEVFSILRDKKRCSDIVDHAYSEIIGNPEYWIETFVKRFDRLVERLLIKRQRYLKNDLTTGRKKKNILLLCAHKPSIDPRLEWISKGVPSDFQVTQVGVLHEGSTESCVNHSNYGSLILAKPRVVFEAEMLKSWFPKSGNNSSGWAALSEINYISSVLAMNDLQLIELFAAPAYPDRVNAFKWYLQYILNTTATLVSQVKRLSGYKLIIATDLDALPAALIIKGMTGTPVLYDAHEYWPEADVASFEFEKVFWGAMERRLVQVVDYRQTVSPGLADIMTSLYDVRFFVVPNCEPISSSKYSTSMVRNHDGKCHFIFQGNFAPKRGLDLLIDAWISTDDRAILVLRGPDNEYKSTLIAQASRTGLLDSRIRFVAPVCESELVSSARHGDVGLIPYTPSGLNYTNCCPNKTSQYMAAGIPILANSTNFVRQIVDESGSGIVVDFLKTQDVIRAVLWFVENPDARVEMGKRAYSYFENKFSWDVVSLPMYCAIESLTSDMSVGPLRVFPEKVQIVLYQKIDQESGAAVGALQEAPLQSWKKIWRLLPVSFRLKFGPKIRQALRLAFH